MRSLFSIFGQKSQRGRSLPAPEDPPVEASAGPLEADLPADSSPAPELPVVSGAINAPAPDASETPEVVPDEYLTLELADFLPNIPSYALKVDGADPSTPLLFEMAGIGKCLFHGQS